jgi:hypothetical protein
MSRLYNHYFFNEPHLLDRQRIEQERRNNEEWERYECEEVAHRLIMDGLPIQYEIMTRKVADQTNTELNITGWKARWEEYKEPQHISKVLEDLFIGLQQSQPR